MSRVREAGLGPPAAREARDLPKEEVLEGDRERTRTDDAHVAAHHVEELRELVERELAHDPTDPGVARVVVALVGLASVVAAPVVVLVARASAVVHRAELQEAEFVAVATDAALSEHDPTADGASQGQPGESEDRRQRHEGAQRHHEVERALAGSGVAASRGGDRRADDEGQATRAMAVDDAAGIGMRNLGCSIGHEAADSFRRPADERS